MPRLLAALLTVTLLTLAAHVSAQPTPPPAVSAAAPGPIHIHVRGTSELQAIATAEPDGFSLRGELIDDAGSPIPHAAITIQAFSPDDARTPVRLGALAPCEGEPRRAVRSGGDETSIETNERGAFCATGKTSLPKVNLKLR